MAKAEAKKEKRTMTVFGGTLNIRAGASLEADIVGELPEGTEVEILDEQEDWYKIEAGFILARWVK